MSHFAVLPMAETEYANVSLWPRIHCPSADEALAAYHRWSGGGMNMESHTVRLVWATEFRPFDKDGDWMTDWHAPKAEQDDHYVWFSYAPPLTECWELSW